MPGWAARQPPPSASTDDPTSPVSRHRRDHNAEAVPRATSSNSGSPRARERTPNSRRKVPPAAVHVAHDDGSTAPDDRFTRWNGMPVGVSNAGSSRPASSAAPASNCPSYSSRQGAPQPDPHNAALQVAIVYASVLPFRAAAHATPAGVSLGGPSQSRPAPCAHPPPPALSSSSACAPSSPPTTRMLVSNTDTSSGASNRTASTTVDTAHRKSARLPTRARASRESTSVNANPPRTSSSVPRSRRMDDRGAHASGRSSSAGYPCVM